jgi:hypothetical protein
MAFTKILAGILAASLLFPAAALADEPLTEADAPEGEYTELQDLRLRQDISDFNHFYAGQDGYAAAADDDLSAEASYGDGDGGSGGGYVTFGTPATSTFLGTLPEDHSDSLMDSVEFGVNWRADVSDAGDRSYRSLGRSLTGSEIDRIGFRADLTALMHDEAEEGHSSAWRLTGMLGSTSLSLLSNDDLSKPDAGGLLWDVGVGWSSGAMSLSAGYQSAYGLAEDGKDRAAIAVLSLGADYAILPGLSVYGEFNVIDGPLERTDTGPGAIVIVGTGVSF